LEQGMQLMINGKLETLEVSTVLDVLKSKDIDPQLVAVELNTQMVDQEFLGTTSVKDGDKLEFLFFMGGGA
jgi:sulfur carrier protein